MAWMKGHFLPRKPSGQVLIVLDGHSSHVSDIEILDFANENDIALLCLSSHSTHYLTAARQKLLKVFKALLT
jgi:hypothetical protein